MKNLKDATREHFAEVNLSEDQIENLSLLMNDRDSLKPEEEKGFEKKWALLGLVAVLLLGLFIGSYSNGNDRTTDIATEVTYNHAKLKPLEITSQRLSDISKYFASHEIRIVENSSVLAGFEWSLKGGRFCSIQGTDAAQLRYKTKSDETVSVYMAPYQPETMGELPSVERGGAPKRVVSKGNEVWIWVEQNQVIATTIPVSD